jgi:hypothetical protein
MTKLEMNADAAFPMIRLSLLFWAPSGWGGKCARVD